MSGSGSAWGSGANPKWRWSGVLKSFLLSPCALMGIVVLVLPACDGSPTSPSGSPNLVVNLTDDHTNAVDEVNIFFASVTANPTDGPLEILELTLEQNPQDLLVL